MLQVHHIAITVSNLEKSKDFYGAILKHFDYTLHFSNEDICVMAPPKNSDNMPEFLIYAAKEDQLANTHTLYDPGVHHYCFKVDDKKIIDDIFKTALEFGVEILDEPKNYPNYAKNTGGSEYYAVYFNDPDNIKLEFTCISK